jgi:putative flippase GtrA
VTQGASAPRREHAGRRFVARFWPRHGDKVRYLVVGGWNTLIFNGLFALLYFLLQEDLPPSAILVMAYLIASVNGFLSFRYLVFAPVGHPVIEYARYQAIYVPILVLNAIVLPLALQYTTLSAYAVQAGFAIFSVIAAYLGNKYFAFRRPTAAG